MDVKATTAIDYEWQANFGKQESVCIEIVFIYLYAQLSYWRKKKVQSPFLYFEIHSLVFYQLYETLGHAR